MTTMYVVIRGQRYEMADLGSLTLWDWMDIQKQTGLTMERLEECALDFAGVGDEGARFASPVAVFGSPDHVMLMAVQVWAARRAAGESVASIREASDIPLNEWSVEAVRDEDDDEPEPTADPTPADSALVESAGLPIEP